jgi:hypothetical protein
MWDFAFWNALRSLGKDKIVLYNTTSKYTTKILTGFDDPVMKFLV